MTWLAASAVFALLAVLAGTSPRPPGAWFDRLLHLFGIGAVSARSTAVSLWAASAMFSAFAGLALERLWAVSGALLAIDAGAIGLALGLALVWLGARGSGGSGRGVGLAD